MRIAFLPEGSGEIKALPGLLRKLEHRCGHTMLAPLQLNVDPLAPVNVIAREAGKVHARLLQRRVDLAVVLMDRENVDDAIGICAHLDPENAARHSRSFRHFLHVLGDPAYAAGCRRART